MHRIQFSIWKPYDSPLKNRTLLEFLPFLFLKRVYSSKQLAFLHFFFIFHSQRLKSKYFKVRCLRNLTHLFYIFSCHTHKNFTLGFEVFPGKPTATSLSVFLFGIMVLRIFKKYLERLQTKELVAFVGLNLFGLNLSPVW